MESESKALQRFENGAKFLIWFGAGILFVFMVLLLFQGIWIRDQYNPEVTGSIGDFIGGIVGAFWALAGVLFFYIALRYQKSELQLQREELKATRSILRKQSTSLYKQQFENTFFQLLDVLSSAQIPDDSKIKGVVEYEYDELSKSAEFDKTLGAMAEPNMIIDRFNKSSKPIFNDVKRYVNIFNSICGYIKESEISEKEFYTGLVHDQFSKSDKCLLFFFCISEVDGVLKDNILYCRLTENLNNGHIIENFFNEVKFN